MMRSVLLLVGALSVCAAFAPQPLVSTPRRSSTSLNVVEITQAIEMNRQEFAFWFIGASGSAGLARAAFPRMYKQVKYVQSLAGVGPTLGGEKLGLSPLCGYPEDLAVADVEMILNNKLSIAQIINDYPIEGNFLSKKGYLTFEAFERANEGANPLAVRAIFDTFAQSTDVADPSLAQAKMKSFREDMNSINGALLKSKLTSFAAIATLLFLLGLADVVAAGHAYQGWFPEWPGAQNFPACLLDPETGPWTIPNYWI